MQYEAQLSDGRTVVMESDHEPNNDEVLAAVGSYEKGLESNSAKALLRGIGVGAAPTTAFSVAAGAVAPIATGAAAAFPATLPFSPLIGAGAGLIAGTGAAALTEFGQEKIAKAVLPEETYWHLKNQLEADTKYHEYAQLAGQVLSGAPSMKFATVSGKLLRELPKRAAVGAGVGAALPLLQGRLPTWRDPAMGAAFGTVYEGPRNWAAFGKPAGTFVPQKTIAQEHETPALEEAAPTTEAAEAQKGLQPTTPRVADEAAQDLITQINNLAQDPETQGFTIEDGKRVPIIPNMDKVRQLQRLQGQLDEILKGKSTASESAVEKASKATGENKFAVQNMTHEGLDAINQERKAIDTPIEIADAPTDDPNNPYNRSRESGNFMTIDRKANKIVIFPEQFTAWFNKDLGHLSPEQRQAALRARLNHEKIHLGVNDQDALDYWGKMTGFEKWAEERIYLRGGRRTPELSDTMMGHEAIRRRLEMASQMGPAEFLEAVTGERWTLKTVGAMSDLVRTLREMSTMQGKEQQAIFDRISKNLDVVAQALRAQESPGSRRKYEPGQEEMFPKLTARGVAEESIPEQRAAPEGVIPKRMTEPELSPVARQFIEQPVEPKKIDVSKMKEGAGPVRPSYTYPRFADFADMVKSNMGDVRPDKLASMWEDLVWKHLQEATPQRLADLRKALSLEKKLGTREIPADSEQAYRKRVQTEIAVKMLADSQPDKSTLNRTSITPDDIDFGNRKAKESPWTAIPKDKSMSTEVLNSLVRDQARRSSRDPVSWTKNLLALLDTRTGEVELVSAYPHGRSGAMFTEPGMAKFKARPNKPVSDMPSYYQPIYRILLKSPVQKFHQHFKGMDEFNSALGTEGNRRALEASNAVRTETGFENIPKGEMTATEAGAVLDTVVGDVGKVETVDDMRESLSEIAWRNENGKMTERDWSAISALKKAATIIRQENPDWTPEAVADHVLNTFYENITKNEGYEDYVQKTLGRFARPAGIAGGGGTAQPAVTPTGTPEGGVNPEIAAPSRPEPAGAPPGQPTAGITPETTKAPPESFQPQERPMPERYESPLRGQPAIEPEPAASKAIQTEFALPGSQRKMADVIDRDVNRLRMSVAAWVKRRGIKFDISAAADRASNLAVVLSNRVQNFIRLKVQDQRNLSAANALVQSGAWEAKYKMSDEAKAMYDSLLKDDPRLEQADKLLASSDLKKQSIGRAMKNSAEGLAIRTLLRIGALDHVGAEYVFREDAYRMLPQYQQMLRSGEIMARKKMSSKDPRTRLEGQEQLRAVEMLKPELDHAIKNWRNPELRQVALKMRMELDNQYDREVQSGHSLRYDPDYLPGRFDGDIFDDYQVRFFSGGGIFGREFHSPKTFTSYYEAASKGPFVPVTRDGSSLVAHRIRQGSMQSNKRSVFLPAIKELTDPVTGEKVGAEPKKVAGRWQSPSPAHELFYLNGPRQKPIAVRHDFADVIHELYDPSALKKWPVTRELLEFGQRLKHTLLFLDVFHLMRLGYYGASIMGKEMGYRGGLSLLEYRPQDLKAALESGAVSKESYKWATEPIKIGPDTVTRLELAEIMMNKTGLNVGRIMDALYMDLVKNVPLISGFNKFVFQKLQRGLMIQSAVHEMERLSRKFPEMNVDKLARDVARDTNTYFGSLGRQGIFRSATFQDLSRLPFLAPQWVEGLVRKELGFSGRLAGTAGRAVGLPYRQGLPAMGTLGFGMARGLVAMLAITQLMNLAFRRKPTWENEEKGHKFDAWIPSVEEPGKGYWLSPLAIFQELSHDLIRLNETKPKFWDALNQIGQNKLSPYGRAAYIAATGTKMGGQRMTTTPGVMAEIGRQFVPLPITVSSIAGRIGHKIAPQVFPGQKPSQLQRQLIASAGVKVEPSLTASQQVGQLAKDFVEQNGLKKEIGYDLVMTDEPGYYKLRAALKSGDEREAAKTLEELLKTRSLQQVFQSMREWSNRPSTGSHAYEKYFLSTLSESQLELYTKMQEEKVEVLDKFVNLVAGLK